MAHLLFSLFFFFNDTATTEIYTLSLHDALPISGRARSAADGRPGSRCRSAGSGRRGRASPRAYASSPCRSAEQDRKSTRLNSSHSQISYAVFCLKKKKNNKKQTHNCTSIRESHS